MIVKFLHSNILIVLVSAFALSLILTMPNNGYSQPGNNGNWITDPKDKRIALVIGNSDYHGTHEDLDNPVNDAQAISSKLRKMGYFVTTIENGNYAVLKKAMDGFVSNAKDAKVALFFFAGHGMQIISEDNASLRNQLLPIDYATIIDISKANTPSANMIDLANFLSQLENSGAASRVVILDACRNIPDRLTDSEDQHIEENSALDELDRRAATTKLLRNSAVRTVKLRSSGATIARSGFSEMKQRPGTLVAYSTGTGQVAKDGIGNAQNSPFTAALLKHIDSPDQKIEDIFKNVRSEVLQMTSQSQFQQTPLVFNTLDRDIFLVAQLPRDDFLKLMQTYLKSRGCYAGSIDGKWGKESSRGLDRFKEMSSLSIEKENIDMGTLNAIRNYLATTSSIEFCQPGTISTQQREAPARSAVTTSVSASSDSCTRRAQRWCSNPANSDAIGFQACMVQAKAGCRS